MRWAGHVDVWETGEVRTKFRYRSPKDKRPPGRPRYRWKDNIKMNLQEVGWGKDWTDLVQDSDRWRALLNALMNLRVP
jgi:hypothetical protein